MGEPLLVGGLLFTFFFGDQRQEMGPAVFGGAAVPMKFVIDRKATLADFAVTAILSHSVLLSNICAIPLVADL